MRVKGSSAVTRSTRNAAHGGDKVNSLVASTQTSLIVRRMKDEEAEKVSSLFARVVTALPYYNDWAKESEVAKYSAALLRQGLLADPDSVLIATTETEIIGFCITRQDDSLIWLSWFGVHPSYRRGGVGSALINKMEETVRNGKSHKIWCDCRTENKASAVLLANHDYKQICTVRNHWYRQDFILWEKIIL
jgi:ribosomal protein S18 acetylase RimI-like enzyme